MFEIETNQLTLRTLREEDVTNEYVGWLNDPESNKYLEVRHNPQTLDTCRAFVSACNADSSTYLFGIFLKTTGKHIGNIKIGLIDSVHKRGEVGLFIGDKQCWGKGYAAQAVRGIAAYAFSELRLQRLEAGCYEPNLASLNAFLKAGYMLEGFKRMHVQSDGKRVGCYMLGIVADEFSE
jgi:ribosomal-protein-alanine N-acetyltransferase